MDSPLEDADGDHRVQTSETEPEDVDTNDNGADGLDNEFDQEHGIPVSQAQPTLHYGLDDKDGGDGSESIIDDDDKEVMDDPASKLESALESIRARIQEARKVLSDAEFMRIHAVEQYLLLRAEGYKKGDASRKVAKRQHKSIHWARSLIQWGQE